MSEYYTAYIFRGNDEIEVTAKLYAHGEYESGIDRLGGYWMEATEDPVFYEYTAFDDYGVELVLTPREMLDSEKQMIESYWSGTTDWSNATDWYNETEDNLNDV